MPCTTLFTEKHRVRSLVASLVIIVATLTLTVDSALAAAKTLMMNPVRIVFTDRQRTMNAHISNPTQEPVTYAISTVTMRKDAKGQFSEAVTETEEERAIRSMVRFSPRRATIEPGKRQVVKLMVNKPSNLQPGEYQTRLRLSPQPSEHKNADPGPGALVKRQSKIELEIIVDSTFPIVIQHGDIAAQVAPVAVSVKQAPESPSGMAAEVKLSRSGTASSFGSVRLHYIPTNNPKGIREIGFVQGMSIYLPETERAISIPLANISRPELAAGTVRVSYLPGTGSNNPRGQSGQQVVKDFPLR